MVFTIVDTQVPDEGHIRVEDEEQHPCRGDREEDPGKPAVCNSEETEQTGETEVR